MRLIILRLVSISLMLGNAFGQWTEPDSTWCPQSGPLAQAPWISNDNLRLYFSSTAYLFVMERSSPDSAWGPYHGLPTHINSTPTQRCPAESPTGDTLYFVGDPRSDCPSYGSYDVYFTVRTDTGWGLVQNPGPNVNSQYREFSVGISRDGSTLLTASARDGTIEAQLYWHALQQDHSWGPANNFGQAVNGPAYPGKEHPTLSPDNNRILFCHRDEMLGDIWESRKVNGVWQQAVPLPSPPNNWPELSYDEDPCVANDGRTLWFMQADYDGFYYRIMVSVDTSVLSVPSLPNRSPVLEPKLAASPDSFGNLRLEVSGLGLVGNHGVDIYDILGRLVARKEAMFVTGPSQSVAFLSSLELPSGSYAVSLALPKNNLQAKFTVVR